MTTMTTMMMMAIIITSLTLARPLSAIRANECATREDDQAPEKEKENISLRYKDKGKNESIERHQYPPQYPDFL